MKKFSDSQKTNNVELKTWYGTLVANYLIKSVSNEVKSLKEYAKFSENENKLLGRCKQLINEIKEELSTLNKSKDNESDVNRLNSIACSIEELNQKQEILDAIVTQGFTEEFAKSLLNDLTIINKQKKSSEKELINNLSSLFVVACFNISGDFVKDVSGNLKKYLTAKPDLAKKILKDSTFSSITNSNIDELLRNAIDLYPSTKLLKAKSKLYNEFSAELEKHNKNIEEIDSRLEEIEQELAGDSITESYIFEKKKKKKNKNKKGGTEPKEPKEPKGSGEPQGSGEPNPDPKPADDISNWDKDKIQAFAKSRISKIKSMVSSPDFDPSKIEELKAELQKYFGLDAGIAIEKDENGQYSIKSSKGNIDDLKIRDDLSVNDIKPYYEKEQEQKQKEETKKDDLTKEKEDLTKKKEQEQKKIESKIDDFNKNVNDKQKVPKKDAAKKVKERSKDSDNSLFNRLYNAKNIFSLISIGLQALVIGVFSLFKDSDDGNYSSDDWTFDLDEIEKLGGDESIPELGEDEDKTKAIEKLEKEVEKEDEDTKKLQLMKIANLKINDELEEPKEFTPKPLKEITNDMTDEEKAKVQEENNQIQIENDKGRKDYELAKQKYESDKLFLTHQKELQEDAKKQLKEKYGIDEVNDEMIKQEEERIKNKGKEPKEPNEPTEPKEDDKDDPNDVGDHETEEGDDDTSDDVDDEDETGNKVKLRNPKKVWKTRPKKSGKGRTKNYYDKDGNSISKKEFNEKVKHYEEVKKKNQGSTTQNSSLHITSLKNYILEQLNR